MYTLTKGVLSISARDFVFVRGIIKKDGKIFIVSTSVDYAGCPPLKNIIRAEMIISGWILEPINNN